MGSQLAVRRASSVALVCGSLALACSCAHVPAYMVEAPKGLTVSEAKQRLCRFAKSRLPPYPVKVTKPSGERVWLKKAIRVTDSSFWYPDWVPHYAGAHTMGSVSVYVGQQDGGWKIRQLTFDKVKGVQISSSGSLDAWGIWTLIIGLAGMASPYEYSLTAVTGYRLESRWREGKLVYGAWPVGQEVALHPTWSWTSQWRTFFPFYLFHSPWNPRGSKFHRAGEAIALLAQRARSNEVITDDGSLWP